MLALLAAPACALDLALPTGSESVLEETEPLASHRLATGPFADGALPGMPVEGAVTRQAWQVPIPGLSALALIAPLRTQIEEQGARILLDCAAEACGGFDFRIGVEVLPPPAMFVDLDDFHYLAAEGDGEWISLLASRSAERGFLQVVRVVAPGPDAAIPGPEPALSDGPYAVSGIDPDAPPGERPIVTSAPGSLGARLEAEGRVVLEGLAFATGSADLAPDLSPDLDPADEALAALAEWLAANPSARVVLVGHTDATGALDANIALSRQRARAVVDRLVRAFGADAARLDAQGMGYLAPRATNLTQEGRDANRRVEAVVLPPR